MELNHLAEIVIDRISSLALGQVHFLESPDFVLFAAQEPLLFLAIPHHLRNRPAFGVRRRHDQGGFALSDDRYVLVCDRLQTFDVVFYFVNSTERVELRKTGPLAIG